MSPETREVVERMYEVLLEEIRTHRPELLGEGFTVAEIYQNLVPYRTHRDRIGIEMNGDYEHALLRLLAGEGDYVELESEAARTRLRDELESLHPDTGVYRNFAACEVRLNEELLPASGRGDGPDAGGTDSRAAGEHEDAPGPESSSNGSGLPWAEATSPEDRPTSAGEVEQLGAGGGAQGPDEVAAEAAADEAAPDREGLAEEDGGDEPPEEADPDATCRWCRERLPDRDDIRFCPFCGSGVDRVPCPSCGTELEEDWIFCVACGTQVEG